MDTEPPSFLVNFLIENALSLGVFCVLLCLSALISGAEVALFSLSQTEINEQENTDATGQLLAQMLNRPKKLLATILIANNLVNISVVLVFAPMGEMLFKGLSPIFRAVLDVGVVTFFILFFGEILPKVYANRNNVQFSRWVVRPLRFLEIIFSPVSAPMRDAIIWLNKQLGGQRSHISVGQLSQALELTSQEETTQEEQKILEGIVSFGNTETSEIMSPRIDIFAVNQSLSFGEMVAQVVENGYSRVPVYQDSIDNITGILYAKDILPYLHETDFNWNSIKRKAFFVPETKKLDDLLSEFQNRKNHLAIVVDEYGGTSGIITLEDIIEEIVGEISDEYDADDSFYTKIDEKNFLFEGKTPLKDFYRIMDLSHPQEETFEQARGEAETLAGFILEVTGAFPYKGQFISFGNYSFTVENMDKKRIKQIKISIYA